MFRFLAKVFSIAILFFLFSFLFLSSVSAQQCDPIPYKPNMNVDTQNVCTNSLGVRQYLMVGYPFNQNCEAPTFLCEFSRFCTKYTGQQCCTGAAGVGRLSYNYCNQTSVTPNGNFFDYTIQCCFNPTPTPTPTP